MNKNFFTAKFFTISALIFLASCTQEPAPVVDRSREDFGLSAAAKQLADDYNFVDKVDDSGSSTKIVPTAVIEEESDFLPKEQIVQESENLQNSDFDNSNQASNIIEQEKQKREDEDLGEMRIVEVQPGQTLESIADENNVPLRTIIDANNLTPPYDLLTGQRIFIPKGEFHVVKTGETLFSISRDYGVDVTSLARINDISGRDARVGETLQIPHKNLDEKPQQAAVNKITGKLDVAEEIVAPIAVIGDEEQGPAAPPKKEEVKISEKTSEKKSAKKEDEAIKISTDKKAVKAEKSENLKEENVKVTFKDDGKFAWPTKGTIVKKFSKKNDGINIATAEGSKVRAAKVGEVVYAGSELKGYGNLVLLKHPDGYLSAYAHMKNIKVKKGDKVGKGAIVGEVGQTGKVKSPQLFFAIRKGKEATDPMKFLR